jgi:acyl-CoA reductase-like NAD-dependent aldehyde dehydrogenase
MSSEVSPTVEIKEYRNFIGGEWVPAASGESFEDHDPFDGSLVARAAAGTRADAEAAIDAAAAAFPSWAATPPTEKQRLFLKAAEIVERRQPEYVRMLAAETGAGSGFAGFQLRWVTGCLRQAAGWVFQSTGELIPSDEPGQTHMAIRRPLGVIAGFSPWNGAGVLSWRTVIAPIAFGNTVVLKPSELAPVTAGLLVCEVMEEAGFPPGVINLVTHAPGEAEPIADAFFESEHVKCINFTGSSRTGRLLAERAGRHLKRIVLELGGYNPIVVLRDADLEYAVNATTFGAFFHQGEICMNARKAIVERPLYDEFVEQLVGRAEDLAIGDPKDPTTAIGPLITSQALEQVAADVGDAIAKGAKVRTGNGTDGPCFRPTVLTDVPEEAILYSEETFGPVLVVESVDSVEEAVAAANQHRYGLSAAVITANSDLGLELAGRIESGMVRINDQTVADEPQMPLGGVRDSGWGRAGPHAVEDFTQVQWVSVTSGPRTFPI